MRKLAAALTALLFLTSCMTEVLTVHMDYISHTDLASSYVGTPDPLLARALVGQRLIVSWGIPLRYKDSHNFEIRIKLRYGNREEATTVVPFTRRQGWYVYSLTNADYFAKKGIKTYNVQLYADGELLDQWQHQLWVELIEFPPDEAPEAEIDFEDEEDEDDRENGDDDDTDTSNDDEVQQAVPLQ